MPEFTYDDAVGALEAAGGVYEDGAWVYPVESGWAREMWPERTEPIRILESRVLTEPDLAVDFALLCLTARTAYEGLP